MDITLALGGGGARGNAHIGVLRRLEQEQIRVQAVAGTSFGGIVAALYAAGFSPDEIEKNFQHVNQTRLYGRSSGDQPSLFNLTGAENLLEQWLGKRTFADLRMPCALTAVDLTSASEVTLKHGRVVDAVRATIALPGVFPPYQMGDHQLVDGGVMDPVPVAVARSLVPSLPVVAVVLTPGIEHAGQAAHIPLPVPIPAPLARRIKRTRIAQALSIFLRGVDIEGRMMAQLRLQVEQPEVIIRPAVEDIGLLDRVDVSLLVRLGEEAVDAVLPEIKRIASSPDNGRRNISRQEPD